MSKECKFDFKLTNKNNISFSIVTYFFTLYLYAVLFFQFTSGEYCTK